MKAILFAVLVLFPSVVFAELDPALRVKAAENFVVKLGKEAIEVLEATKDDEDARREAFKRILKASFDMDRIGKFAMGRYWAVATPAERRTYQTLFETMVIDVYSDRFANYSGQSFDVTGTQPAGKKDYIVNSVITGDSGAPVKVDWRVRDQKIIDVIVEGVSMSVTQRSEFSSVIQRGGGQIASLIEHLQK